MKNYFVKDVSYPPEPMFWVFDGNSTYDPVDFKALSLIETQQGNFHLDR
jgi:hypothetical protein